MSAYEALMLAVGWRPRFADYMTNFVLSVEACSHSDDCRGRSVCRYGVKRVSGTLHGVEEKRGTRMKT